MKLKFGKEYIRRLKLVLKCKWNGKNKIVAINTWAISVLRYGAGLINWNKEEVQKIDRKRRKMMTIYGALHRKSDVDRIYVPRGKREKGLVSRDNCIRREDFYFLLVCRNSVEKLLEGVKLIGVIDVDYCIDKDEYKKRRMDEMETERTDKIMLDQFFREIGGKN